MMNMAQEPHLYADFAVSSELGGMHGFVEQGGQQQVFDLHPGGGNPAWRPGFFLDGALPHDDDEDDVAASLVACGGLSTLSLFNPEVDVAVAGLPQQPFHLPAPPPPARMDAAAYTDHHQPPRQQQLRSSKYLAPARELLGEFCNLAGASTHKRRLHHESAGAVDHPSSNVLLSMDILELQKRKARLISMLDEVDRRYRRYCEQMRAVAAEFEEVAGGEGAAAAYTAMALKAMSRHFRCLRDGIAGQIKVARKAMGERDPVAPGTTMGETPRLKLLDQCLRQQQQRAAAAHHLDGGGVAGAGGFMDGGGHPWRPQRGLPERSVSILRAWLFEHFLHPYPSDVDKHILARQTGLSRSQVSNWFINARVRLWKPMVEEMYMEEFKEQDNTNQLSSPPAPLRVADAVEEEQKPSSAGFLLNDSESLSSVISSSGGNPNYHHHHNQQRVPATSARAAESFGGGSVSHLDYFGPYREGGGRSVQSFGGGGGVVSLTLGLQHHGGVGGGGGVNLSFSPASNQHSIFFNGGSVGGGIEQPVVPFSILGSEAQNLPYRNLMGAQLLNDFAG